LKINRIIPFCNLFMGRPSYKILSGNDGVDVVLLEQMLTVQL